mmetsp:Transcript_17972/g.32502  ORF Transcript_17972/g.32502 Transcript_17972/m.32502 type:complete len:182 (-) Transcript_17972:29-574(-)
MTSSPLLLRSAVNRVVASAAARRKISFRKSSLSTLSYHHHHHHHHPSLFDDAEDAEDASSSSSKPRRTAAPLAKYAAMTAMDYVQSNLSDAMTAALYGNSVLAMMVDVMAVKQSEREQEGEREEEDSRWEDIVTQITDESASPSEDLSIWQISTLKRRKKMMNKHKLRKRKKKMRLKTRRQ